jgi:hypothetical protein
MTTISVDSDAIGNLDISTVKIAIESWLDNSPKQFDLEIKFSIDYPLDPQDPRELSEIPEIRLWFLRLDAHYPYLPLLLDWQAGELARYVAMSIPHQFSLKDGIQYNPEALELWVMHRVFLLTNWLQNQQIQGRDRLKFMTQMLGYELDNSLFELLESSK